MDASLSSFFDDPDEPQTPNRSPSRLDFCMEDLDDSPTHGLDWSCTPFRDSCPYTFIDEGAFAVDIAPLDRAHLLIVDPQQATDSCTHENANMPHKPPVQLEHLMDSVVIEPQAPIPVRPPSVQLQVDAQESTPPPPRNATQRLNYPHHGFSRSALLQQKTLWNSRHEEWAEWQSRIEQDAGHKQESVGNDAYTGLDTIQSDVAENPPPYMRTPPSGLERDLADHLPRKHEDVHSSIYPRVGDISALRDPYSVNIDRCFFRYPLWTLHKTLYVFNMHQRSTMLAPPALVHDTAQVQSSISSSTLSSYTSSTSADEESDCTLVAEDSPVADSRLHQMESSRDTSSPCTHPSWTRLCRWELSWYARWELLIGLFQRDRIKCDHSDTPAKLTSPLGPKTAAPLPPAPAFRIPVEDGDDDDDEDYGTLISNSSLSVDFEEECERAIAFYNRESKCSGMTL